MTPTPEPDPIHLSVKPWTSPNPPPSMTGWLSHWVTVALIALGAAAATLCFIADATNLPGLRTVGLVVAIGSFLAQAVHTWRRWRAGRDHVRWLLSPPSADTLDDQ